MGKRSTPGKSPMIRMDRGEAARVAKGRYNDLLSSCIAAMEIEEKQSFERYLEGVPASYRRRYLEVYAGTASLRDVIAAKCLDCMRYQRVEVTLCPSKKCPNWRERPYQDKPSTTPEASPSL